MKRIACLILLLTLAFALEATAADGDTNLPPAAVQEIFLNKTLKLLDIDRNSRGYNNTVTATFAQGGGIEAKSTSGAKNTGTLSIDDSGVACMKWNNSIWPDWCFSLHQDGTKVVFRFTNSGKDKFLLQNAN